MKKNPSYIRGNTVIRVKLAILQLLDGSESCYAHPESGGSNSLVQLIQW